MIKETSGRMNTEVGGMASNDFVVDFFGKCSCFIGTRFS